MVKAYTIYEKKMRVFFHRIKFQCQRFGCIKGIKWIELNQIEWAWKKGRIHWIKYNAHDVGATSF